jgi:hypothetical protein
VPPIGGWQERIDRGGRLAWTMHEGMDFLGHASEYRDVEA